jgi:hypothetical protein
MAGVGLPKEYGYVILVASSSALVAAWHGINVLPQLQSPFYSWLESRLEANAMGH